MVGFKQTQKSVTALTPDFEQKWKEYNGEEEFLVIMGLAQEGIRQVTKRLPM